MKKQIKLLLVTVFVLVLSGCNKSVESETLVGYMTIENNKLYFDEVEIVRSEDAKRIEELGLDPDVDLPSGKYIYNPDDEKREYELTDKTTYTFF